MSWIDRLNDSASTWGEALLRASWQGAALAVAAWIVCRLWKRMPANVHCAIWLLVCVKMLVGLLPVAVALPLLPAEKPADMPAVSALPEMGLSMPTSILEPTVQTPTLSTGSYVLLAWLLGIAVVLGTVALTLVSVRRHLGRAQEIANSDLPELAARIGLRRIPKLLKTESEVGVLTIGAFRPVILISASTLDRCTPEELRLVLAHELAHLKRGDAWLALLPQFVGALFFFHPAAWLMSKEFELAREAACDEIAIRSLEARSDVFGRLLLKLSSRRELAASFFVLGISSHFKVLSRRISMLSHHSPASGPRRLGRHIAVIAIVGALFVVPWNLVRAQAPAPAPVKAPVVQTKKADPAPAKRPQVKSAPAKKTTAANIKLKKARGPVAVVFKVQHALASEIESALNKKPRDKDIKIFADPKSNMLIVYGPFSKTKPVIDEAQRLDKKKSSSDPFKKADDKSMGWIIYPTGNKDPEVMVAKVLEMIRKQQVRPKLEMIVDPSSKRILLKGDPAAVKDSISKLDGLKQEGSKPPQERQTYHVPIMFQSAAEVAKKLDAEFRPRYSKDDLIIVHDSATNTVMIGAAPEIAKEVRGRLLILDQRPPSSNPFEGVRILKRLPVKNIDAKKAFGKIYEFLPKDTTVNFISYDPTDNSIVARASEAEMDTIEKFLASIDKKD